METFNVEAEMKAHLRDSRQFKNIGQVTTTMIRLTKLIRASDTTLCGGERF